MSVSVSPAPDSAAVVQNIYAAFSRGDIDTVLASLASGVVWSHEGPEIISIAGIRHGVGEAAGFFQAIANDHLNPELDIADFISSGDSVASFGRYRCTIKATGKAVDAPFAHLWKLRGGKVISYTGFTNTAAVAEAHR